MSAGREYRWEEAGVVRYATVERKLIRDAAGTPRATGVILIRPGNDAGAPTVLTTSDLRILIDMLEC